MQICGGSEAVRGGAVQLWIMDVPSGVEHPGGQTIIFIETGDLTFTAHRVSAILVLLL